MERIDPKAFNKTIQEADVRMLFNHNPDHVLARTKNGTLELGTDEAGLTYDGVINRDDPQAMSTHAKIARGDVDQSSFAFRVVAEEWRDASDEFDIPQRTILEAELFDVSPVTYPAYEGTDVGVRAASLGIVSSLLGLSERQRELLIRAIEDELELPDGFAQAIDVISPVFEGLLRSVEEEGTEDESESAAADKEESESAEEPSESEVGADEEEVEAGAPAAEEAPVQDEAEGETDDERKQRFDRWFARFTKLEGRMPTIGEIEAQFPSSATGETS